MSYLCPGLAQAMLLRHTHIRSAYAMPGTHIGYAATSLDVAFQAVGAALESIVNDNSLCEQVRIPQLLGHVRRMTQYCHRV
eukprot:2959570-Rhodomonas_salina.2